MRAMLVAAAVAVAGCGTSELVIGTDYLPDGAIPIAPPTDRSQLDGAACDGGACEEGGGSADAAPPPPPIDASTEPSNTCLTARDLGTVSGDTGGASVQGQGTCSEWVSIRASEDDSSAFGTAMKVKLTLTPSGGDFDLYAFFDPDHDDLRCSAPSGSSFNRGDTPEVVELTWGEGTVANDSDDGRTVLAEIVKAGDPCGAGTGTWSLNVQGKQ